MNPSFHEPVMVLHLIALQSVLHFSSMPLRKEKKFPNSFLHQKYFDKEVLMFFWQKQCL